MRTEPSVFAFWTAVATDPSNHGLASDGELVSSADMGIVLSGEKGLLFLLYGVSLTCSCSVLVSCLVGKSVFECRWRRRMWRVRHPPHKRSSTLLPLKSKSLGSNCNCFLLLPLAVQTEFKSPFFRRLNLYNIHSQSQPWPQHGSQGRGHCSTNKRGG